MVDEFERAHLEPLLDFLVRGFVWVSRPIGVGS
jgi:hypothetical protein